MPTLKDVADKAGVSASTVSYVLNGKKKVKASTKKRIYNAVEELNYSPDRIARSLRTKTTGTLGVVVTNLNDLFFTDILRAVEKTANKYNYNVILCDTDNSAQREIEKVNNLLSQRIDGLIIAGTGKNKMPFPADINIPTVSIDRIISNGDCSIMVDNVMGGRLATDCLISRRLSPVAIITYSTMISTFFDRVYGYRKTLEEHGHSYNQSLVVETEFATYNEGYDAAVELLSRNVSFRSVFVCCDLLAIGAMRAFIDNGLKVPGDVSIIGYDDIQISKMLIPSLSSVSQPKFEMGELAVEALFKLISGEKLEQAEYILKPELIVRESI